MRYNSGVKKQIHARKNKIKYGMQSEQQDVSFGVYRIDLSVAVQLEFYLGGGKKRGGSLVLWVVGMASRVLNGFFLEWGSFFWDSVLGG